MTDWLPDDWPFLAMRLLALGCYLLTLAPVLARIGAHDDWPTVRARIGTAALLLYVVYSQVYSSAVRIWDVTPWWGPWSISCAACLSSFVFLWGVWSWRRSSTGA